MSLCLGTAAAATSLPGINEDSLQALAVREPNNSQNWMDLGFVAAHRGEVALADGYFQQGIKFSSHKDETALKAGRIWVSLGKTRPSLPYLLPNLSHLEVDELDRLQLELEKEKLYALQLNVLRSLGPRSKSFHPVNKKAADLAFRMGDFPRCREILVKFNLQLDYESAGNLLLVNLFVGGDLDGKILSSLNKRFPHGEMALLVSLNYAQSGNWKQAKILLEKETDTLAFLDYRYLLKAMEAAGGDRYDEAADLFQKVVEDAKERAAAMATAGNDPRGNPNGSGAIENAKEAMKALAYTELFRLYASTGNKFKSDQLWEALKEEYEGRDAGLQDFLAFQFQVRGYEKQAKYFYRTALRGHPGDLPALGALWEDLVAKEEYETLNNGVQAALARDSLSCEANLLAMNYYLKKNDGLALVPHAIRASVSCYEQVETYFILGKVYLEMSMPEEAKASFSTFVRKGGEASRVPLGVR